MPGLPVFTVTVPPATSMGVPEEPMLPLPDTRLTVPELKFTLLVRVMLPEPLAVRLNVPEAPVPRVRPLTTMLELFPLVANETAAVPVTLRFPSIASVPPELTVMGLVVPEMFPKVVVLEAPVVLIVSDLAPRVIVCPADVNAPPLLNCRL